jgi:cob(I)alamin adenosyltransferase
MLSGDFDIIILDEINVALFYNLITTQDILDFMSRTPCAVELILTGRYAADEVIQAADLVSDMVEIKHYFNKGILARDGIER